jgi:HAD superfamily hydrolase (TIGR01509 family)
MAGAAPRIKGFCFDMDGTLTNSDDLHFETYRDTLLKMAPEYNNGQPLERAYYDAKLSGSANEIIVPTLLPHWEQARMEELWLAKEALYRERSVNISPLPGVLRILDWCDTQKVGYVLVTNAPRIDCIHTLHSLKLHERFDNSKIVIGQEVARPKPFPDAYNEGLRRLGLAAEECLAFEDSFSGLASAVAAGIPTVAVLTSRAEAEMKEKGAFLTIKDFEAPSLWEVLERGR